MANHLDIGQRGESIALEYLQQAGHQILETNWRFSRAEVDIISKDGEVLVFTEVKTRSADLYGKPEASIDSKKEALIADAAAVYMEQISHKWEIRFDIIGIVLKGESAYTLEHYEDAFFPSI